MRLNRNTLILLVVGVLAIGKFAFPQQFAALQKLFDSNFDSNTAQLEPAAKKGAQSTARANGANGSAIENAVQAAEYARLEQAVANQEFEVWLDELPFNVVKILKDDREGSQHQRFLVSAPGLPTLLIAHNIDLAERVPLREGDRVHIRGRYEWNNKGGVIHWTHHDPKGRIKGGWIRHQANTYK